MHEEHHVSPISCSNAHAKSKKKTTATNAEDKKIKKRLRDPEVVESMEKPLEEALVYLNHLLKIGEHVEKLFHRSFYFTELMYTVVQSIFSCFVPYQQNIFFFLWVIYDKASISYWCPSLALFSFHGSAFVVYQASSLNPYLCCSFFIYIPDILHTIFLASVTGGIKEDQNECRL
jgi:hypothetical protein